MKSIKSKVTLRTFNDALSLVVILIGLYLIATPWIPQLELWWNKATKDTPAYATGLLADEEDSDTSQDDSPPAFPEENRIIIPSIALDSEIFSGQSASTLNFGPWQRPNTTTPDQGGNTVIAGHRFAYGSDGKWIFYHLDKLQDGDRIGVYWEGVEYIYQVRRQHVVAPTAIEIEGNTSNDQLTLYTCTPLWTAENRLVVVADLIEKNDPSDTDEVTDEA